MGKDGRLFNLEGTGWAVKSVKYTRGVCIAIRDCIQNRIQGVYVSLRDCIQIKIGLYLYCFLETRVQIFKRQSSNTYIVSMQ